MRAWHEDKENTKRHSDSGEHEERHGRPRSKKPANERLSDPRPVHESVFAEEEESHDQVELVLVADQQIGANCEWQNELRLVS